MHTDGCKFQNRASLLKEITVHVCASYVHMHAQIIMKINVMVNIYTDILSFKIYEDPFIGCGEIAKIKPFMHTYHF